ncbi:hypothetical protein CC78DRAFT_537371 [Lojkania enalia]|uniref:Thioesterase domain-containing protein n=1 Tax=Lojkania enalia TaxID=147567 RepID=A0A9P4K096_9PLEO|nr:hypothetical protein CC78DRAFT_537371 [Didymosphaeria enalia]
MWQRNGVQSWVELYKKPPQGSKAVTKTISLCKYDSGLMGFTGICHGGAAMTLMDEALGFAMVANETEKLGDWAKMSLDWAGLLKKGRPITEVLNGMMVTAKLDHTFLRPVLCPGIVGIEVVVLEDKEYKMRMRGVMKDGDGNPLLQADGLWVRIGGSRL